MIDVELIKELVAKYGTPFYYFDEDGFQKNYFNLRNEFIKKYDNYQIAYSFKTNYTPYICELVKSNGGYAEVVSGMELELAYRLGFKPNEIVYNGPYKGEELGRHLLVGGIVNLDCAEEVEAVLKLARNTNKLIKVGLRLNFDIGANYISRFGFDINSDSFNKIVTEIKNTKNVKVSGIHCHISRARNIEAWSRRIETLLRISREFFDDELEYIDIGSGMFGDMNETMRSQFSIHIPTYQEYACVVGGKMKEHFKSQKPMLISEPGTTLVSRYLYLVTSVVQIKDISGKTFATVDSSYQNAGESCKMKKLPYRIIKNGGTQTKRIADIMGYTCLEQDCLYHEMYDNIGVGTILEFENVGGYSIVYKPPFIRPNCSIFALSEYHPEIEIKRRENFCDIFGSYRFGGI